MQIIRLRLKEDKNEHVNVSDVAMVFGGGGHVKAAGCKINGTPEQIKTTLVKVIKKHIGIQGRSLKSLSNFGERQGTLKSLRRL